MDQILPEEEIKTARLFRDGTNQAIRIPREFEPPGTEVTIRKVAVLP
jgi:virulence-associated protein VagC